MAMLFDQHGVTLKADAHVLTLAGAPDFATAATLGQAGRTWLHGVKGAVEIDASGVTTSSSATITVLLEWLRTAQGQACDISRIALPDVMHELVALSRLDRVLP